MRLSFNLHPILEGEHQPPIVVGCGLLHHRQPEGIVKLSNAILQLMQSEHEPADEVSFGLPLFFLLLEGIHPGLGLFIPCRNLKGYALESFVADLLNAMGYRTELSPQEGDSGIDVTAYKDELPPRILV